MSYIHKLNTKKDKMKLSIYKLSKLSGLAEPTIKNALATKAKPTDSTIKTIKLIAEALDISLAELFCEPNEAVHRSDNETIHLFKIIESLSDEAKSHILWITTNLIK